MRFVSNSLLLVRVGLCLGCRGSDSLPGADRGAKYQAEHDCGGGGEDGFVFAGEFSEAVHGSWGASEDRFVGKVTLNVGGEAAGRPIPSAPVLFESFHHDPIQL